MKTWINAQGQYLEDVNKTYRDIISKRTKNKKIKTKKIILKKLDIENNGL